MPSLRFPQTAASVLVLAVTLTAALGVPGHTATVHTGNGPTTTSHPTRRGTSGATATGFPAGSIPAVDRPADTTQTATATASRDGLNRAAQLADERLDRALAQFTRNSDATPAAARTDITVAVQRGQSALTYRTGIAPISGPGAVRPPDSLRFATGAYAFSGAVALALVAAHRLSLGDSAGHWLRGLPRAWNRVTLRQLLTHTSGIPDFATSSAFRRALSIAPRSTLAPRKLLSYAGRKLRFRAGTRYAYSNSDNVLVALIDQTASGLPYGRDVLQLLARPLGLTAPAGILSGPDDASAFVRAYVRGALTSRAVHAVQFTFRPGSSSPPGPGRNSAGLAIFRYQTRCGTVYGYSVSTSGFTQFAAATASGKRSLAVSVNEQITQRVQSAELGRLRQIFTLAACAALAR